MSNVVDLFTESQEYEIEYMYTDDGDIKAVSHSDWPFWIVKNGDERGLVCKETDEPFGVLGKNNFNTLLMCWLLIDDPKLIDMAARRDDE